MKKSNLITLLSTTIATLFLITGDAFADDTWNGTDTTGNATRTGNVGIGTTTPDQKLHVNGHLKLDGEAPVLFANSENGASGFRIYVTNITDAYDDLFRVQNSGTTVFNIKGDGDTGIGTTNPLDELHLEGEFRINDSLGDTLRFGALGGISNRFDIGLTEDTPGTEELFFYGGDSSNSYQMGRFRINAKETVMSGNVGIGTTSPNGKLHIYRDSAIGTAPQLIISGRITTYDIGDLYVLDSKNLSTGVGYAAKVFGVNIQEQTDANNQVVQRATYGGITGASAIYIGADDVNQGGFGILTSPQNSSAGTILTERFTVKGNGNVGIGTTTPDYSLMVDGAIKANYGVDKGLRLGPLDTVWPNGSTKAIEAVWEDGVDKLNIFTPGNDVNNLTPRITILGRNSGNVGIGTTSPDYKLDVNGTIRAKEIKVESDFADFVFEENYNLPSLVHVESYIKENKHLPDIPSAKDIKEDGLSMAEMMAKQMQKIEELTLYVIQLEKKNMELEKRLVAVEKDK